MATGDTYDHTDLYSCHVCFEDQTKRTPRLLSCHHSFCQDCIKKLVKQGKVECPTCRNTTPIAEGDVTKLPMNFMLIKMKECVDKLLHDQMLCQMCGLTTANKKCWECMLLLCDQCIVKHGGSEGFEDHQILLLCPEHPKGVTNFLCLKCFKGVCSICLMNDHKSHREYTMLYRTGICEIKENLKKLKTDVNDNFVKVIRKTLNEEQLLQSQTLQRDMQSLYESYIEKAEEVKEIIDHLQSTNKSMETILEQQNEAEGLLEQMDACIAGDNSTIMKVYPELKAQTEGLLNRDEMKVLMDMLPEGNSYFRSFNVDTMAEIPIFSKKLKYETQNMKQLSVVNPQRISCITPTRLAIFDLDSSVDTTIDIRTASIETCTYHSRLRDAVYCNGCFWCISEKTINKSDWTTGNEMLIFETNLKSLSKIFTGIFPSMILFDGHLGRIYEFTNKKLKKVLIDTHVDHIAVHKINGVPCGYIVINTYGNTIDLYSTEWELQTEINCCDINIRNPSECISTPMGLMVADTGNNCITLLDHQGELLYSAVLGEEEGVRRPVSIDYMEPYLWIAECDKYEGHRSIKCFELKPNVL